MPSVLLCLAFAALEAPRLRGDAARWTSDLLQLGLALLAALACLGTARREHGLARSFFLLLAASMGLWAGGQWLWTSRQAAEQWSWLMAARDVLFVGSAAPFIAACVLRPHRPRPGALDLAADVGLVSVLALFLYAYFPIAREAVGADPYAGSAPVLYNPQRLVVLAALLWLLRDATGPFRTLYAQLALAMAVFHLFGTLGNIALLSGQYRPGLHDLPWALPFLWIALAARDFRDRRREQGGEPDADLESWRPADWRAARRSGALALIAVVMVPLVHQLTMLAGASDPELPALRLRLAAGGTLLVGGLYLARQLYALRRIAALQRVREVRFRALAEHSADAIGVVEKDGLLGYLSASSERVTGYRPEELHGRSPLELLPEPEREPLGRVLAEVAAHPAGRASGMVRFQRRDGGIRDGALTAVNLLASPAVRGVVLHLRDVSEAQRAELESTRSLSLLEATLEATADGILVATRGGRVERVNQRFAEMWRLAAEPRSDDGGVAVAALVERELLEPGAFLERLRELAGDSEAESFDTLRLHGGRVVECRSLPQRIAGEVVGRVFSFRDVSERAHAEQATARLVAILEATPDLVATCDARLALRYLNRAGRLMLGADAATAREPLLLADLYASGAREHLLAEALPTALREGVWSGETRLRHLAGGELPVLQVLLAHRGPDGAVDFVSTVARDLRQRLDAEAALRRSHTMAALGSLVAGVTHEVRNPLFAISSTLDAFEARFGGQPVPDRYVGVLRAQLERLTGLMRDLLEYANPPGLELAEGRLEGVVAAALAACAALQQRSSVAIESRLAPDLPPLRMDERRLVQVLQNLLQNAVQHSPARGSVRLEARVVREAAGPAIECAIDDDGPGVPERDLMRLFEPFFTRRTGGTGLGLSIVQRIVSDHGGRVTAANRPSGGARFTVTLPALEHRP